jgi:hypothetical protein
MDKVKSIWIIASLLMAILVGCSGTGPNAGNPLTPSGTDITAASSAERARSQTHLWGYYDVRIDLETKTVTARRTTVRPCLRRMS